jgi:hypothetical protein
MPSTRLIVRGAPFSSSFKGNLNDLWQAMLNRLEVISPFGEVQLRIGGLKPTSNVGPWFKDGQKLYVWDETLKDYIPLDISDSLASVSTLVTSALSAYAKTADVNSALASGIATLNARIDALEGSVGSSGALLSVSQSTALPSGSLDSSSTTIDIPFNSVSYDTLSKFSAGRYTIPSDGVYRITYRFHTEVTSGSATSVSVLANLLKNGSGLGAASSGTSESGGYVAEVNFEGALVTGDQIFANVIVTADGGPVTVQVSPSNTSLTISKV